MDRLLSHFPHTIAKNWRWPADTSSDLLQKMCAEDASSDFLLWICSPSHADITAVEPGKCEWRVPICWRRDHIVNSVCWWHWALMLCLGQRLHCDPAWCCQILCCPMQTSWLLWWGTWKPVQGSWAAVHGESPQSPPCLSDQSLGCLLLSQLSWSAVWFRPVQVGSLGWPKCVFHQV